MTLASDTSLALAARLLTAEALRSTGKAGTETPGATAARVCDKLRVVLTPFVGSAGLHALMRRALALAKTQSAALMAVQCLEDSSFWGLEKVGKGRGAAQETARVEGEGAGRVLLAHLLDLMVTFIGEPLMLHLVRDTWPDLPDGALRSRTDGRGRGGGRP